MSFSAAAGGDHDAQPERRSHTVPVGAAARDLSADIHSLFRKRPVLLAHRVSAAAGGGSGGHVVHLRYEQSAYSRGRSGVRRGLVPLRDVLSRRVGAIETTSAVSDRILSGGFIRRSAGRTVRRDCGATLIP